MIEGEVLSQINKEFRPKYINRWVHNQATKININPQKGWVLLVVGLTSDGSCWAAKPNSVGSCLQQDPMTLGPVGSY
jgi:hypothetical protein